MTTAEARAHLLAGCSAAYQRAMSRSARGVRAGILGGEQAIRATPDDPDLDRWLAAVLAAIAAARAAVRDDEDGFELGGIATVRNLVEELQAQRPRRP